MTDKRKAVEHLIPNQQVKGENKKGKPQQAPSVDS